jgi:acyl-CoA dehydrogenase
MLTVMDLTHLSWPFFDSANIELAREFERWGCGELAEFEQDEGGDGKAARQIFERLASSRWLRSTLPTQTSGQRPRLAFAV